MEDDGDLARDRDLRFLHADAFDQLYKFLFDLTDGKNWPARFHTAAVCSFS
jgi:hypothetical protein